MEKRVQSISRAEKEERHMMHKKIAITLPDDFLGRIEKEREKIHLNRSAFFVKVLNYFWGIDSFVEEKLVKKYEPIYRALREEDKKLSKEMMSIAKKTIPKY